MLREVKNLIQYCEINNFPINEMDKDDFKAIENSLSYQRYLLARSVLDLKREIIRPFEGIAMCIIDKVDNLLKRTKTKGDNLDD